MTDLVELIDHIGESPVAVGGTSLGAALVMQLSTQIATSHLVLSRPAFGVDGDTNNFKVFRVLQRIVQERSRSEWLMTLEQTEEFQGLAMSAPRNQETYRRLLNHPRLEDLMDWMRALDEEALSVEPSDISQYQGRVDVIGQSHDALHPLQLALDLASSTLTQGSTKLRQALLQMMNTKNLCDTHCMRYSNATTIYNRETVGGLSFWEIQRMLGLTISCQAKACRILD